MKYCDYLVNGLNFPTEYPNYNGYTDIKYPINDIVDIDQNSHYSYGTDDK